MSFHIHPPASEAVNSHHNAAERHNVAWVQRHSPGMAVDGDMLRRLQRTRFSRLAAFTYPRVGPDELALITNWITWLFLHDDFYCDDNDADEASLVTLHEGVLAVLRGERRPVVGDASLLHMLADLRRRMLAWADLGWLSRFVVSVDRYLQATRWEARNRAQSVTPPLGAYVKMRGFTGAMDTVYDCIELGEHLHLGPAVREHSAIVALQQMAGNCVCWANDIFSVNKELLEHNSHNLVFVLRQELGLTLPEALERAVAMHDAELQAFEWSAARLPEFRHEFGLEMAGAIRIYVAGLRSWVRGNTAWSWETPRYKGCLSMCGHAAEV